MLDGECWTTEVATLTGINTEAEIRSIEGCDTRDSASGNAAGSTSGSTAEGVCTPTPIMQTWPLPQRPGYVQVNPLIIVPGHHVTTARMNLIQACLSCLHPHCTPVQQRPCCFTSKLMQ